MTQERKQLLIKVLCTMLPYGVNVRTAVSTKELTCEILSKIINGENNFTILPYLRSMSSMTNEEREEYRALGGIMSYNSEHDTWALCAFTPEAYDWLNKKQFDYRGLIPMGFALEAPEDMYI